MAGFQFSETMSGTYVRDGQERPFTFSATARAASGWQFLRDRRAELQGTVDADGLAAGAHLEGTLTIDPLVGRIIRYEFDFLGEDGRRYRFVGQKDVKPTQPVESMTTLPAEVLDESGNVHAQANVKFHARDLVSFLSSFRPVL